MSFINFIWNYLKSSKKILIIAPIFMILEVVGDLLQPYLTQKIIDEGIAYGNKGLVLKFGTIMAVVAVLGLCCGIINTILATIVSQNFGTILREDGFNKVQHLSFKNLDKLNPSNIVVRLTNDINQLQNFVLMSLRILIRSPLMFIGSLVMAIITSKELSPIIFILTAFIIILLYLIIKKSYPVFLDTQVSLDKLNVIIKENFSAIRTVKAFVAEDKEEDKFNEKSMDLMKKNIKSSRIVALIIPMLMLSINMGIIFILWFGGNLAYNGGIAVGAIVAFINYLLQLMFSLIIAGMLLMTVSRALVSGKRVRELLNEEPDIKEDKNPVHKENLSGNIEFKHVFFKYEDSDKDWVLKDISFTAKNGDTIGIVGATGAGKTTLVELIPRFYDATKGEVLIDNINVKKYKEKTLRNNMSIVLQRALLFSGTIRTNIEQGKEDASLEDIRNAAKASQAHEFIERFEERYDSVVYQKGSNLSGGQKQRVSIARGLVKTPSVLILDDSTSALDAKSEELVKQALNKEFDDTTCFIVAQKISSVIDADKILVLDNGVLTGLGNHDELLKNNKVYNEIYKSQIGKEG